MAFYKCPKNYKKKLEEYTWEEIQAIGAAGTGDQYFAIGDTKTIQLNGRVGTYNFTNKSLKVFIIEFNYRNSNGIYFQGFKTTTDIDVALADSNYNKKSSDGTLNYNMNHWGDSEKNRNYGGWKGCDLRYDILGSCETAPDGYGATATTSRVGYDATSAAKSSPVANTLMAALPASLRNRLAPWTIYTDNVGGLGSSSGKVTSSIDYLPLLSAYEVNGTTSTANANEADWQSQMSYYSNGKSKAKKMHRSTSSQCIWLLRSPYLSSTEMFNAINVSGGKGNLSSNYSGGLAPAFRVA